ncbi:hypothetical protein [Pseudonocardia abyssalis]|jgi:predicted phage tail protein|uniref:Uncharacterized protein n=2 Tax=Pseudonocardia abyssalis TaxID=2792008 RepID=A0ABS6UWN7_9PSEU|nr:hypothetical protein [Pseudonocardia abyssalis]MBW0114082.1 hypothetical protein [Pseudonocardia abyssalis]MBW0136641.1 hypothetical protein [Pseudonocardia abyssalis]
MLDDGSLRVLIAVDTTRMGRQGLSGWRMRVGGPVSKQVARRTGVSPEAVQAVLGAAFFLSSVWYVAATIAAIVRER